MNEATVSLTGNVATAIRFSRSDRGIAVASFRIACTPRHFDRTSGMWVDERTSFVSVTCFRSLAENVVTSLTKGDPVMLTGKLRVVPWERDDKSGLSVEVEASAVGHDLGRGQTRFARVRREMTAAEAGTEGTGEAGTEGTADRTDDQTAADARGSVETTSPGDDRDLTDRPVIVAA